MSHDPLTHIRASICTPALSVMSGAVTHAGLPPSLLGVAAMARGQLTLEHARGPQRVEDRSVRSGGRGHSDVVHASQGDLRGSDPDILHTTRRCDA
jgi:hypothetical protein